MRATTGDRCPLVRCRARLLFTIDRLGRSVATCPQCARRKAGICRDCPAPVAGTIGKSLRCAVHTAAARLEAGRRYTNWHREERNAAHRKRSKRPEVRARKRETRKAWAQARPEKVTQYRRRYHLKRTPGYVAGYQRHNARPERQAQKRAQAIARYYELHPTRPAPVCRSCGVAIPYTGKGRPRVTCGARYVCLNAGVAA
jgi:hypothetical protein